MYHYTWMYETDAAAILLLPLLYETDFAATLMLFLLTNKISERRWKFFRLNSEPSGLMPVATLLRLTFLT